jgi:hypothetical protein
LQRVIAIMQIIAGFRVKHGMTVNIVNSKKIL